MRSARPARQPSRPHTLVWLAAAALVVALLACEHATSPAASPRTDATLASTPTPPAPAPVEAPPPAPPPAPVPTSPADVARVTVAEAAALRDAGKAVIVDVRDATSYEVGHVAGALHIPLLELEGRLAELPRDKRIITYCA